MDNPDILNLILSKTDNYYCLLVCKQWYNIIIKNSIICNKCNKVIKMYDTTLWITDDDDVVCHGYYGNKEKYKILKQMIRCDNRFLQKIKRVSIGLWLSSIHPGHIIIYKQSINDEWYIHALKINGLYLKYIKNPTYDMCVNAVKRTESAFKYVPKHYQTHELCCKAITLNIRNLQYIDNPSEDLILDYIKGRSYLGDDFITLIKNPTEDIYIEVFKKNKECMKYIDYE